MQDPLHNINYMLMGPKGSNSPLHVDWPPVGSFHLVVEGRKLFCYVHCNPEFIPDYIRTYSPGCVPYSWHEFMACYEWCRQNGGSVFDLKAGKKV